MKKLIALIIKLRFAMDPNRCNRTELRQLIARVRRGNLGQVHTFALSGQLDWRIVRFKGSTYRFLLREK